MSDSSGWETYSKLVLQQLENLNQGIVDLRSEMQELKGQLTELKAKEDRVQDLKAWKDKIDEIASPTQLKTAINDIEELKMYKTKAVTTFMVVQFLMATALALAKFF
tara:strand:+ start:4538 stop:4858 length:321 start_codon:yes stop_codon:yes gene_type:complete